MANDGQGYDNEKRGVIFPSEYKKTAIAKGQPNAENLPDGSGSLVVNGVKFYVSSWTKTGAKGKFISFSIEEESVAQARSAARKGGGGNSGGYAAPKGGAPQGKKPSAPAVEDFDDDDLPF